MLRISNVWKWSGFVLLFICSVYRPASAQAPTAAFDANDTIVCVGNSISFTDLSLAGGAAITGWNWTFGDGGSSTSQNPGYAYTMGGNYTVTLVVSDANGNSDTATKVIYVLLAQAINNTVRICSPQSSTTIMAIDPAINGVTGTWFTASSGVIASPANDTTVISNLISGTYLFFWVVSDGTCSDADQVTVIVDQPVIVSAGPDQQVCSTTGSTTLAGSNPAPGTGIWSTGSAAIITTPSNRNSTVTGLTVPGTYTMVWTVTNGSCVTRDTMNITVTSPLVPVAGTDQQVCASPGTATLAAGNPSPGTGTWTSSSGAVIASPSSASSNVSGLTTAGSYSFIWTVSNGACVSRDTMLITVTAPVTSNAGNNQQICTSTAQGTLSGNNPAPGTGVWTALNGGTITSPGSAVTTVTGLNTAGFYNFVWTITNGPCITRDTVTFIVRNPVVANAGADQQLCNATTATLSGNSPAPGTGLWSTTGAAVIASPSSATTTVSNLSVGQNIFVYTTTYGACISRDTVIIRIDALIAANAGPDLQICESQTSVTMAGNNPAPGTGVWTKLNGGTITTPSSPVTGITALTPGTHVFIWTITNGTCISRDTMRVVVNVQVPSNAGLDQQVCQGTTVSLSGNNPFPASGLWTTTSPATISSPSSPNSALGGITNAGVYVFVWTVTNGACVLRDTVRITVDSLIAANAGPDQNLCAATGATLAGNTPASGSGTWTSLGSAVVSNPASASSAVTGLSYGNNQFVWTIVNGNCTSRDTVRIRVDSLITALAGPDQQICSSPGTATLSGNTPAAGSGVWTTTSSATITNPASATSGVSNLTTAGTYTFIWTVTNGTCVSRDTMSITVSQLITSNAGPDQTLCNAASATLAANNAAPGTGTWTSTSAAVIVSPNNPSTSVSNLQAGTYTFVWTIVNGSCTSADTVTINVDSLIPANAGADQQLCAGSAIVLNGNTPATGSGLWTALNGGTPSNPTSATTTIGGLSAAGIYAFVWTVTNGSCISSDTVNITIDQAVTANAGSDQTLCNSNNTLLAGNNAAPGTGTWSSTSTAIIAAPNNPASAVTNLQAGTYSFVWTIVNGSCTSSDTVQITVDSLLVANAGSDQQLCSGSAISLTANTPPTGNGTWTALNGGTPANPSSSNTAIGGISNAGTYSFVWTISNGSCTSSDTVQIIIDSLVAANAGSDQFICEIFNANLNGNLPGLGLGQWSTTGTAVIALTGDPNSSVSGLSYGVNTFVWTVTNGTCTSSDTVDINVDSLVVVNAGSDQQACAGSLISLSGNTPVNGVGLWTSSGAALVDNPGSENSTVSNLQPGINEFVWNIINGACQSSDTVIVLINPLPQADAGADQFVLSGTNVILGGSPSASGGTGSYTWQWNPGAALNDSTLANPSVTVNVTTTFVLTVTDSLGCTDSDTITIWVNNPPDAQNDTVTTAEDTPLVIDVLLNDSDPDTNINPASVAVLLGPFNGTATILPGGQISYTPAPDFYGQDSVFYTVCDSGMPVYCDSAWILITVTPVNDAPLAVDDFVSTPEDSCIQVAVLANDSDVENMIDLNTLVILSGPANGTYSLDPLTGILTYCPDSNFTGSDTLIYAICDSGFPLPALCDTAIVVITVVPDNDPPVAINDTAYNCSGDALIAIVLANDFDPEGDSLSLAILTPPLNGAALVSPGQEIIYTSNPGSAGWDSLQYVICDQQTPAACDTAWMLIYVHALAQATSTATAILCYGDSSGTIDISMVNPGTYSYSWSNGSTDEDLDSLAAGVYTVSILDSNGCVLVLSDTVSGPAAPLAGITVVQPILCYGDTSGAIDLQVSGGTSPYSWSWNNGSTEEDLDSLLAGVYQVTVTDSNGCILALSDSVSAPAAPLSAVISGNDIACYGDSSGTILVSVNGGTPGYTYAWSNGAADSLLVNLLAGVYTVTIRDTNACTLVLTDTITELSTPIVINALVSDPYCISGALGSVQITASGGMAPLAYLWSNGDTLGQIDSLYAGVYQLMVTDSIGCVSTVNYTLQDSSAVSIALSGTMFCEGDSLLLSVPYYTGLSYQWYQNGNVMPADTTHQLVVTAGGDYALSVNSGCGLFTDGPVTLTENPLPLVSAGSDATISCDSVLTLTAVGAQNYSWTPAAWCTTPDQPSTEISVAVTTSFVVTGTDANGCAGTDTVLVNVICDSLEIPSGFSPNNDGFNDYFTITDIDRYPNCNLKIFNRWGALVFEMDRYNNSWSGLSNVDLIKMGEELPDGTYYYVLDPGNGDAVRNGFVVLRR
ncbi:MAG: tandem-95 repeat protein [Bacteroidia bacterium]|nr:tandem-95 repeat protein [Bacteroidia bacterium]